MDRVALSAFLWRWERYIDNLQRLRLTGQREHLVHSNASSNRCIAQAGLANGFLHTFRTQFGYAGELCSESVFFVLLCFLPRVV